MSYESLEEIEAYCRRQDLPFWRAVLLSDMEERQIPEEESLRGMKGVWQAMLQASEEYDARLKSRSGLVGGLGGRLDAYRQKDRPLCGDFMAAVMGEALKMAESNACMKRIVAAPTAGACGVLPAVLIPLWRAAGLSETEMLQALYVAGGIGQVIAARAYIAGAAGGCQAEIGTASAMAAGAAVHLRGGSPAQICHAAAMALKNLMGLVCDPVAGLVEVPCVKRNVVGAVNALSCADMALAGITSAIPPDQVIDAMRAVGDAMSPTLKETAKGGVADTPRAREIVKCMRSQSTD